MIPEFQAYVGPQPFEEKDKTIFFGRNREVRSLRSLVIAHRLVLVYAQSGAGKTSLINAGLIPLLRENKFDVLPVARVKGTPLKDIKTEEISNIFVFNALTSLIKGECNPESLTKMKLVDFLSEQKRNHVKDDPPSPRAIIFDQFEEIFSMYQYRWKDREGFFEQVNDALETDPLLRIVFVIREDFIAQLDPYAYLLPERLRARFHLESLRREAALLAVKEPLRDTGRSFAEGVAEKLVDDLLTTQVETMPGKTIDVTGEFIEAVQLQVVCQNLWQEMPPDEKQITFQHLKNYGNVEQELAIFYAEAIKAAAEKARVDEEILRTLCSRAFITTMNTRGMVYRAEESTAGVPNAAIDVLESKHLIRAEWRAGARWYELTHDRFIKPILNSNKNFNEDLAEKKRRERELAAEKKQAEKEKSRNRIIKGFAIISGILLISVILLAYIVAQNQINQSQKEKDAVNKVEISPVGVAISPDGKKVYITDSDRNTISVIDTATNDVTASVPVRLKTQGIAITSDGKKAYLAHLIDNNISIIDTATNSVKGNINVTSPYGLNLIPDGTKLYVASKFNNSVSVIDTSTNKVIETVPVGYWPKEVAVTPDGKKVYVTNYYDRVPGSNDSVVDATIPGSNVSVIDTPCSNVSVIDTENNTVITTVSAGLNLKGIAFTPDGKWVYVANGYNNTVSVIDTATNIVINTLEVGKRPVGVAVIPDGKRAYVANEWDWTVSVIDTATNSVINTLEVGKRPVGVAVTPDGKRVYVANGYDNTVSVIDAENNNVEATVKLLPKTYAANNTYAAYITNQDDNTVSIIDIESDNVTATLNVDKGPVGVAITPDRKSVYVTNCWANTVSVFDTATNNITGTVEVGSMPYGVVVTPDGSKAYVTNWGSNDVSVIDTSTNTITATIPVGTSPEGIVVTPDGTKGYVVNTGSDNVTVLDIATNTVTAIMPVGDLPQGIAVSPEGENVFVANGGSSTVSVINTTMNTVSATITVGENPQGITVSPDGTKAYVANCANNTVSVIDTSTNAVTADVNVGIYPFGISVNPDGTKVYVVNGVSNTVSVINTATNNITANITVGNNSRAFGQFISTAYK